jgi:ankyrin repeat protein
MVVSQGGRTALIWAAMNGHEEVVKALIENGVDMRTKEKVRRKCLSVQGLERMTEVCLGPDCAFSALQGVSVPCTVPMVLLRLPTDY